MVFEVAELLDFVFEDWQVLAREVDFVDQEVAGNDHRVAGDLVCDYIDVPG